MQDTVSSLRKDMRFLGFLLVRMAETRVSNAKGTQYLDMTLADRTGEINCKVWDGNTKPPRVGSVVKVQGLIQEYNGRLQMRVERMRAAEENDPVEMELLVRCAPEKPGDMLAEIEGAIDEMTWEDLKAILKKMIARAGKKLMYYPAAQRLHHAERGGLLHHTLSMLRVARAVAPMYPFLNRDLLFAGVIAHDLGKIDEMQSDETGSVGDYTAEGLLLGHLVDGVAAVRECAREAGVDGEAVLLLSHMIISHHGVPEFGSPRAPMFPEAEALHMIDDLDAKLNEMESVMDRTPAGVFSEKIWSLDRRLYHPRYPLGEKEAPEAEPAPATVEKPSPAGDTGSAAPGRGSYDGLL
ncbi:MAG: HD domain-containing protein [Clostridia bacterium]|nr:HD domain-containing protein [Clostridia bacterium]